MQSARYISDISAISAICWTLWRCICNLLDIVEINKKSVICEYFTQTCPLLFMLAIYWALIDIYLQFVRSIAIVRLHCNMLDIFEMGLKSARYIGDGFKSARYIGDGSAIC